LHVFDEARRISWALRNTAAPARRNVLPDASEPASGSQVYQFAFRILDGFGLPGYKVFRDTEECAKGTRISQQPCFDLIDNNAKDHSWSRTWNQLASKGNRATASVVEIPEYYPRRPDGSAIESGELAVQVGTTSLPIDRKWVQIEVAQNPGEDRFIDDTFNGGGDGDRGTVGGDRHGYSKSASWPT
jgi:hypothetical protein